MISNHERSAEQTWSQ